MEIEDGNAGGFWGLVLQPNKSYTQVVDAPFRISMAALGTTLPKDAARTSVTVTVEKKQFVLCNLTPEKVEQVSLDHVFEEGETISFTAFGTCQVHLTGYYLPPQNFGDMDDDDFDEDDFDEDALYGDDDEDDEDEDDEEDDDEDDEDTAKITELGSDEEVEAPQANKRKANEPQAPQAKKQAVEAAGKPQAQKPQEQKKAENKPQQQQQQQQKKAENKPQQQQQQQQQKKAEEPKGDKKKTLANGLVIEDTKTGQGKVAKKGSTVFMRYTGRLASNNSVFDSNSSGAPFKFRLGAGEVIKGWDLGIDGMTVGGERKLTIPANLAYGAQGAPPSIPKNAKLVFDVKLLDVK